MGENWGRGSTLIPMSERAESIEQQQIESPEDAVPQEEEAPAVPVLTAPAAGVPPLVETPEAFADLVQRYAAGSGPVAADAERASGYRYSQRAYLIQLRREGAGSDLIDPIAIGDLSALNDVLLGEEWIFHAASQDLACFREVGLNPSSIFDTELGARVLGLPKVGLAAVTEDLLGVSLAKEHSAADWSTRPLPEDWLNYAALDVELLIELREELKDRLEKTGKLDWAQQEFAAVLAAPPPAPREEPWRRVSGTHAIKDRRAWAAVRELWQTRDSLAQAEDIAPGRLLPDRAIVAAAAAFPRTRGAMLGLPNFRGRGAKRHADAWFEAVKRAGALADSELPQMRPKSNGGPPPPRSWPDREPLAAARLAEVREVLAAHSESHNIPVENLLLPDLLRRLAWAPPVPFTEEKIAEFLRDGGARQWQLDLLAPELTEALIRGNSAEPS